MKYLILGILVFFAGLFVGRQWLSVSESTQVDTGEQEKKPLYWVAPMDKNYRRDGPGKSPMGMDLVPVYEEDAAAGDDNGITISPFVENNLGVKVASVTSEKLLMPINTIGVVEFDESRITHVHSRVEGWIERLGIASSGDRVSQGQILYELYSPALVSAQEEYLAAVRSGSQHLIRASRSRLLALGLTSEHVSELAKRGRVEQTIQVRAERDGIVIDLNVRDGMFIQPATEVLSFGSLDSVWLIAEVFERQAAMLSEGMSVSASLTAQPGREWNANVNYVYPELDASTRTLKARVRLPNQDGLLKPKMLMQVAMLAEAKQETLSVPRSALIKAENHARVVKALGDGRYQSVLVEAGMEGLASVSEDSELSERRVQILDGLEEGDEIVVSAQFLIDSESNIGEELLRMQKQDKSSTQTSSAVRVMTRGKVEKLMPEMGLVSITHEPIPEWEWPSMKMDFPLGPEISMDRFTPGETIQFELEKTGDWEYLITQAGDKASAGNMNEMDHAALHQLEKQAEQESGQKTVSSQGKVGMLMLDMNMLEVVHEPIPEWDWPVMRMSFLVPEGESVPELQEGDEITFSLTESDMGDYLISNIKRRN